jgi:aminodeoxyfutalosine synthase
LIGGWNLSRILGVSDNALIDRLVPEDLRAIQTKVLAGSRIDEQEALQLFQHSDLNALGILANVVRERKNGNVATYIRNLYVNYSNVCLLSCQFCAFGAKKRV